MHDADDQIAYFLKNRVNAFTSVSISMATDSSNFLSAHTKNSKIDIKETEINLVSTKV